MRIDEYQQLANKTLKQDEQMDMLIHAAMGMATESGEFIDTIKKAKFYGKQLDVANLLEEIGDVMWYCAAAAKALNVKLSDVAVMNVDKLKARYKDGFSSHDALHRDLVAESFAMTNAVDGN